MKEVCRAKLLHKRWKGLTKQGPLWKYIGKVNRSMDVKQQKRARTFEVEILCTFLPSLAREPRKSRRE